MSVADTFNFNHGNEIKGMIESALKKAVSLPIFTVDRDSFLKTELAFYCTPETISKSIATSPAEAGVPYETIEKICRSVIKFETNKLAAISFVSNIPGGVIGGVMASADVVNYFGSLTRLAMKIAFLHGVRFASLEDNALNEEDINRLIPMIGVMVGVVEAEKAVVYVMAHCSAKLSKSISRATLTKTALYPIVKKITGKIGIRMTKQIYADVIAGTMPVIGAGICCGITYFSFKGCGEKLREVLARYYRS